MAFFDPQLAPPIRIIEIVFDFYMSKIDIMPKALKAFRKDFIPAVHDCSGGKVLKIIAHDHLLGMPIFWPEFEKWKAYFQHTGEFPYMWKGLKLFEYEPPRTIDELTQLFTVKDIRGFLKHRRALKGLDKRDSLVKAFQETFTLEEIDEIAKGHVTILRAKHEQRMPKDILDLLLHTISTSISSFRNKENHLRLLSYHASPMRYVYNIPKTWCPVEERFGAMRSKGELRGYPPFFPGDRNTLQLISTRTAEEFGYACDCFPIDITERTKTITPSSPDDHPGLSRVRGLSSWMLQLFQRK